MRSRDISFFNWGQNFRTQGVGVLGVVPSTLHDAVFLQDIGYRSDMGGGRTPLHGEGVALQSADAVVHRPDGPMDAVFFPFLDDVGRAVIPASGARIGSIHVISPGDTDGPLGLRQSGDAEGEGQGPEAR